MTTVTKLLDYGNSFAILFSDGSRILADPISTELFVARSNSHHVISIQRYGNQYKILYDDDSFDFSYPTTNPNHHIVNGHSIDEWIWPIHYRPDGVTKWNLGDGYGPRISPITGLPEFHYGQDINGPSITNTLIVSPSDGIVMGVSTDPFDSYGYNVRIQHNDGSGTLCAHMVARPPVSIGDSVNMGDVIGAVGSTGDATGPHLHFNTQTTYSSSVNDNTEDPLTFMSDRGQSW